MNKCGTERIGLMDFFMCTMSYWGTMLPSPVHR